MHPCFIGLVGDSDIARWPISLHPNIATVSPSHLPCNNSSHVTSATHVRASGHSGFTLQQILPHVKNMITTLLLLQPALIVPCFVVVCGGENDIGSGVPLRSSQVTFQSLLDLFYETNIELSSRSNHHHHGDTPSLYPSRAAVHLIFLGPKFEPWLQNDPASRRSYVQMSITFEQLCQQKKTDYIHYVDCLTMFCGNSKNQPGALYGGTAIPESIYFHSDQLHLSEAGYAKWKSILEDQISMILQDKVSKNATHDEHD